MKTSNHKCYPVFETNQILTSTHLNRMRDYLDEENRLTRNKLIGFGIVCGLKVRLKRKGCIEISKGSGVTTEGYLLALDETAEYTRFKDFVFTVKTKEEEKEIPGLKDKAKLIEIFQEGTDVPDTLPLSDKDDSILKVKVAILFIEFKDEILQSCTGTNCDNKGKKKDCNLKIFLADKNDLTDESSFLDSLNDKYSLPELSIKRFRLFPLVKSIKKFEKDVELSAAFTLPEDKFELAIGKSKLIDQIDDVEVVKDFLGRINNSDYIFKLYNTLIDAELINQIVNSIKSCYDIYKPFLQCEYETNPVDETFAANLQTRIKKNIGDIQYVWDFLCELIKAYNEFREKAFSLLVGCSPAIEHFPQHLLLGIVGSEITCMPRQFRYPFFQPPVYNGMAEQIKEVRHLFKRIITMITGFSIPSAIAVAKYGIKIIPSKEKLRPLSEWSIPFYYFSENKNSKINEVWNYDFYKRCRSKQILSYFSNYYNTADEWVTNPLLYIHDEYPFYRIEGIHGKKADETRNEITAKSKLYNLPFKTIVLNLEQNTGNINIDYDKAFYDLEEEYFFHSRKLIAIISDMKKYYDKLIAPDEKLMEEIEKSYKQINDAGDFRKRIKTIFDCLDNLSNLLKPCLREFKYEDFKTSYKEALGAALNFILVDQDLLEILFYQLKSTDYMKEFEAGDKLINIFTKLVLKLIDSLYHTKLLRIYFGFKRREYYLRVNHLSVFSNFIKKHPGIEHLAGVYKGGTFILVCEGGQVVVDFSLPYFCCTEEYSIPLCDEDNTLGNISITPFARPDFVVTERGKDVSIDILDNNDGFYGSDIEFAKIIRGPDNGDVKRSENKNEIVYSPKTDFTGVDSFTYAIRNIHNKLTDEGVITVVVLEPPLKAVDDNAVASGSEPVEIKVLVNDTYPEGTILKFVDTDEDVIKTKDENKFEIKRSKTGGTIIFTARKGFVGNDEYRYELVSGKRSSEARISVTVINAEQISITAVPLAYSIIGNNPYDMDVLSRCQYDRGKDIELSFYGIEPQIVIYEGVKTLMIKTNLGAEVYLIPQPDKSPFIFRYIPSKSGTDGFQYKIKQDEAVSTSVVTAIVELLSDGIYSISGTVTDKDTREGLVGASTNIDGTSLGASADLNGHYEVAKQELDLKGKTVWARYIGYKPEKAIIENSIINFELIPEAIGEVITTVSGTVSILGDPITNCSVSIKEIQAGTRTGLDGKYKISSKTNLRGKTLVFYLREYPTKEVLIDREIINVELNFPFTAVDDSYEILNNYPRDLKVLENDVFYTPKPITLEFYGTVPNTMQSGNTTLHWIETKKGAKVFLITDQTEIPFFRYFPISEGIDQFQYQIKQGNKTVTATVQIEVEYVAFVAVTGTVTLSGEPEPGVTVQVEGTLLGTTTNLEGAYQIRSDFDLKEKVLLFRFQGYNDRRTIINRDIINIDFGNMISDKLPDLINNADNKIISVITNNDYRAIINNEEIGKNVEGSKRFLDLIKSQRENVSTDLDAGRLNKSIMIEFDKAINPIIKQIESYNEKVAINTVTQEDELKYNINLELFNANVETFLNVVSTSENDIEIGGEIANFINGDLKDKLTLVNSVSEVKTVNTIDKIVLTNPNKPLLSGVITKLVNK